MASVNRNQVTTLRYFRIYVLLFRLVLTLLILFVKLGHAQMNNVLRNICISQSPLHTVMTYNQPFT